MSKQAGHPCPACMAVPCAEYALKNEEPRWRCNSCGAGGLLGGHFSARPDPVRRAAQASSKKHWRAGGRFA